MNRTQMWLTSDFRMVNGPGHPSPEFDALFRQHLLTSMIKQAGLKAAIGGRRWDVCISPLSSKFGTITFGRQDYYKIQVLGTESSKNNTWLWSWANPSIPEGMRLTALSLKAMFRNIPEFQYAGIPLSVADGHKISRVALGIIGATAYYGGNGVYVLITDKSLKLPMDPMCLVNTCIDVIASGLVRVDEDMTVRALMTLAGASEENSVHNTRTFKLKDGSILAIELRNNGVVAALRAMPSMEQPPFTLDIIR